ncbi:MAG: hypothetical protein AAF604_03395 [Acidobacteriota bacterium]
MSEQVFNRLDSEELAAHEQAARLAGLEGEARVDAARTQAGCQRRSFVQLAMSFCRQGDEPLLWGRVAIAAAEASPPPSGPELLPLAWATLGNAHRIAGDLRAAGRCFFIARDLLEDVADPLDLARIYSLEASWVRETRDFGSAISLVEKAMKAVEGVANEKFLARLEVQAGLVMVDLGDHGSATESLAAGLLKLDHQGSPSLRLIAAHNLAFCAFKQGRFDAAMRLVHSLRRDYCDYGNPKLLLLRDWLVARITAGRGHLEEAATLLRSICSECQEQGFPYLAGLIELDRAGVLIDLSQLDRALESAATASYVLDAAGASQKALAAIILLQKGIIKKSAPERLKELVIIAKRHLES